MIRPVPTSAPPSTGEMLARLVRVRSLMTARGLDCCVVASPDNVFYLTNFANFIHERPFILVLPAAGPLRFVVPRLEIPHVRTRAVGDLELVEYPEFPAPASRTWADRLAALIPPRARVGVESTCPLQVYEAISATRVRSDVIDEAREIKSAYEAGRIAYACGLTTDAMRQLLAGARPGRTLPEAATEVTGAMLMRVLHDNPATNMLATKLQAVFQPPSVSHDPHNFTNVNMAMARGGPHVGIMNFVVNGYGAEIERSFFLGEVPEAARRPFEVMLQARHLAFELTIPGNVMSEVDRRVNDVFRKAGYGEFLLHRTGHGIGVTGHEGPFLAEGYDRVIEPGMVFTIEPGVYLPGVGGFRHSDTVMTTGNANVSLTDGSEDLEALTLPIP